jgi:hypothetical protein
VGIIAEIQGSFLKSVNAISCISRFKKSPVLTSIGIENTNETIKTNFW